MQISAVVNRFIVEALLTFIFTNDFKTKYFLRKMFIIADLVYGDRVCTKPPVKYKRQC